MLKAGSSLYRGCPYLYPYCITTWAVCQGVFQNSLKKFVGCLTERGSGFLHPLDTNSIPH